MTSTKTILRAGVLALGIAAFSVPAFAQGTGGGAGGASNAPTGSDINDKAVPGDANTGGTYPPHNQYGTTGSGSGANAPGSLPDGNVQPNGGVDTSRPTGPASGN